MKRCRSALARTRAKNLSVMGSLCLLVVACGGDDLGKPTDTVCPPGSTVTYEADIQPFMADYCTTCHASALHGAARRDAPSDRNFDTQEGVLQFATSVDEEAGASATVVNTEMPPKGSPAPSVAERMKLSEWLACNK